MKIIYLFLIVVVGVHLAYSQPSEAKTSNKTPQTTNQVTNTSESNNTVEGRTETDTETETYRKERDAKDDTFRTHQTQQNEVIKNATWWIAVITGLNLILAIVFATFAGLQWRTMGKGLTKTDAQVKAAERQAIAAETALSGSDYAHRIENRPYVGVTRIDFINTVTSDEWVRVIAHNMNCGRTPALNVQSRIDTGASTLDVIPEGVRQIPKVGLPDKGIHLPGVPTTLIADLPPNHETRIKLRNDPNLRLYAWGTIDYDDIWGYHHQTSFAFVNPDPNKAVWWACSAGNSMTTNDTAPKENKDKDE